MTFFATSVLGRSRNNYRTAISTVFGFARSCGYVPEGHINFAADVALAREGHAEIEIFTADEFSNLLHAAQLDPDNLGSGVNERSAESKAYCRCSCSERSPDCGPRKFNASFGAILDARAWLHSCYRHERATRLKNGSCQSAKTSPHGSRSNPTDADVCCDYGNLPVALLSLAKRAGVKWKHNALRHSFISYRVALTQNLPQVSLEAGNSVQRVNRHYRELVTEGEAKAWFSIRPGSTPK